MDLYCSSLISWGSNSQGQSGTQEDNMLLLNPCKWMTNCLITEISCGDDHSAFVSANGKIYTVGNNNYGKLGIGRMNSRSKQLQEVIGLQGEVGVKVGCGWNFTLALTQSNKLFAWGFGEEGALGNGEWDNSSSPVQVRIGNQFKIVQFDCGSRHCGLVAVENRQRKLFMWGYGGMGQLGTNDCDSQSLPVFIQEVDEPLQISCGVLHSVLLTSKKQVFATGNNQYFQLGTGDRKNKLKFYKVKGLEGVQVKQVSCGHHSGAVTQLGYLYLWGTGIFGQLKQPELFQDIYYKVKSIEIGGCFGIAQDVKGNMWSWGSNNQGELGQGDRLSRGVPTVIQNIEGVKTFASGVAFTIGILQENQENITRSSPVKSQLSPQEATGSVFNNAIIGLSGQASQVESILGNLTPSDRRIKSIELSEEQNNDFKSKEIIKQFGDDFSPQMFSADNQSWSDQKVSQPGTLIRYQEKDDYEMLQCELDCLKEENARLKTEGGQSFKSQYDALKSKFRQLEMSVKKLQNENKSLNNKLGTQTKIIQSIRKELEQKQKQYDEISQENINLKIQLEQVSKQSLIADPPEQKTQNLRAQTIPEVQSPNLRPSLKTSQNYVNRSPNQSPLPQQISFGGREIIIDDKFEDLSESGIEITKNSSIQENDF